MPVIVVGADTALGLAAIDALLDREGEVRAFVTDPVVAADLKARGVKVALGDVSDASHVGGASLNTFSAVLVAAAARDDRERVFASTPAEVFAAWAEGLAAAGVRRAIWIEDEETAGEERAVSLAAPETATVSVTGRSVTEVAADVARLDAAAHV